MNDLGYFQVIKFIFKDDKNPVPEDVTDYYDLPKQKAILEEFTLRKNEINSNLSFSSEQKKIARKTLKEEKLGEFGNKLDAEYGVYREISKNPYPSFLNVFENIRLNKSNFSDFVVEILNFYSSKDYTTTKLILADANPTAQLLYNPNQGKGLNKIKANNLSMGNLPSTWIRETMKISGSLSMMVCQFVKVGTSSDLKVYVPEFNQAGIGEAKKIMFDFKRFLATTTAIKSDILNIIDLSVRFIERTPEYNKGKIKNTIKGFHLVYQKKLGGPTKPGTVTNIAFINTPDFIEYSTKQEGREWIEILEQQRNLISNIDELGDAIQGLMNYRSFLGSTGNAALDNFSKFSYWYAGYLMQQLTKGNKFIRTFKTDTLTKLYTYMEPNLTEIIQNDGFKAVASAIRKSTVSLQYTPKAQRRFEIRYGLAQQLQNKSKSKEDLTTFIGEFIGTYNAETGRFAEKNNGKAVRANVKDAELIQFYSLLDSKPSRLIGALLASYGFALGKREVDEDKVLRLQEDAAKLGYELVRIEEVVQVADNISNDEEENIENN